MNELLASIVSFVEQFDSSDTIQVKVAVSLAVLLGVVAASLAVRYLRTKIRGRYPRHVADVVLMATITVISVGATVALLALWGVTDQAAEAIQRISGVAGTGVEIVLTLAVLAGAYVASGFIDRAVDRFVETHETITEHQSEIAFRVLQLTVYVTAVAVILGMLDVDLSGLLVGAGFLGIIVGMAARQTLGSLLAGFVLMFSRPFEIGDWIEIEDEEGIVTDISIVNTRIQTFDGKYVMIPNDIVSGEKIVNKSRKGRLRVEVEVGVDYASDVGQAADLATDVMKDLDEVLTVPTPQVVMEGFGDSAVVLLLRAWIDKPSSRRQWRARGAIVKEVKKAFEREGIKIPFPQRELTGREESGGLRLSGESAAVEATPDGGAEGSGVGEK